MQHGMLILVLYLVGVRRMIVSQHPLPICCSLMESRDSTRALGHMGRLCLGPHLTSTEVMGALARMRYGSSSVGMLTPSALKVASIEVIACITTLLSKCAHVGAVQECWARCAVTPVHKSGSLQSADNYRGIAIGTLPAKVYAAVIERRLNDYLEANNLRAQGQAGFRRDHRCADQMFILNSLITQARRINPLLFVVSQILERLMTVFPGSCCGVSCGQ